jgi:hypothetical protein
MRTVGGGLGGRGAAACYSLLRGELSLEDMRILIRASHLGETFLV